MKVANAPIFIGGMLKSGTSLFRAMLGQHPNVAAGLETFWFDVVWEVSGRGQEPFEDYLLRMATFFEMSTEDVQGFRRASADVVGFLNRFLGFYASRSGKARWAEKTTGNAGNIERILENWPSAQIVHVTRDPRDVLTSYQQAGKFRGLEAFCRQWADHVGKARQARGVCDDSQYLEVAYEDLVLEPETTMRGVLEFLNEPWCSEVSNFQGKADEYSKVLAGTGRHSTTLKRLSEPLTTARIQIWPDHLGTDEIRLLEQEFAGLGCLEVYRSLLRSQDRGS
jgi:hypothetical protein